MPRFRQVEGHWFYGHFYGHICTKGYFNCAVDSCPFSLKIRFVLHGGKRVPSTVEKVVCSFHCHEFPNNSKNANREIINDERKIIEYGEDVGGVLERKHREWQERAKKDGDEAMKRFIDKKATVEYAYKRPHLSGRKVEQHSGGTMTRYAIDMARHRKMQKQGDVARLEDLNEVGKHHLLKRDGDEVIIFGLKSAVKRMSSTKMILADGTFKCVLHGFSQLYIFHAIMENNVSLPMLFCLLGGKNRRTYKKLITMVEELAVERGVTIFQREVTLMCDFEAPFIGAVQELCGSVAIKCCFFHFSKNIRAKAATIMNDIKKEWGLASETYEMAERTKRRIMMLPLLPVKLITTTVLGLIRRAWADSCPGLSTVFDGLFAKVVRTYIGTPPGTQTPVRARFHPSIWSVSGMSVRTNNPAESVHAQINPEVNGKLSFFHFLSIIEGQMLRGRKRLAAGCRSESRRVERVKNRLLAEELDRLLNGREGVLAFMDNCSSITRLQSIAQAGTMERVSITTVDDIMWTRDNRGLLVAAADDLYHRLCPDGNFGNDEIMSKVATWSFQVIDGGGYEDSDEEELSLVEEGLHESFIALRDQVDEALLTTEDEGRLGEENGESSTNRGVARVTGESPSTTIPVPIHVPVVNFVPVFVPVPVPLFFQSSQTYQTPTPWFPVDSQK